MDELIRDMRDAAKMTLALPDEAVGGVAAQLAFMAQKAADELEKRRWIPVEERLPEGEQSVLVRRKDGGIFLWEYCPYSPTDDIWVDEYSNVFSVYDTTHWMDLPEGPKEDKP